MVNTPEFDQPEEDAIKKIAADSWSKRSAGMPGAASGHAGMRERVASQSRGGGRQMTLPDGTIVEETAGGGIRIAKPESNWKKRYGETVAAMRDRTMSERAEADLKAMDAAPELKFHRMARRGPLKSRSFFAKYGRSAMTGFGMSLMPNTGEAGRAYQSFMNARAIGMSSGGAGVAAIAVLVAQEIKAQFTRAMERSYSGVAGMQESRGVEYSRSAFTGTPQSIHDVLLQAKRFQNGFEAVNSAVKRAFRYGLDQAFGGIASDGKDRNLLEMNHDWYQKRAEIGIISPSVKKANDIQRHRWDAQLNRDGGQYGGWGKTPESIGG